MTARPAHWQVRLTAVAEADYSAIVGWTAARFGVRQARVYAHTIGLAIEALAGGPPLVGLRRRDDIGRGLRSLHVERAGRKGRHLLILRVDAGGAMEVLRILHDAMDLPQQIE